MKKTLISYLFIYAFLLCSYSTMAGFSNYSETNFWTTNGKVRDIKTTNNKIYLAGDFSYVGMATGGGAAFAADTGKVNSAFPAINGDVHAVLPDNNGGFYIGGDFSAVGYQDRENIAHILSDGSVDSDFKIAVNGIVRTLILSVDGKTLYLGGDFTKVAGTARKRLASIKLDTCSLTDWGPEANNTVKTLALSPGGTTVYVGGLFTTINSTTRNRMAAIDLDGDLFGWDPSANSAVNVIQVSADGTVIYVGGHFSTIAGESRSNLVALKTDGTAYAFDPSPNGEVNQIIISQDGTVLYVSGNFTNVGGTARKQLAFINTADGSLTAWEPASVNGEVNKISVSNDESTLYLCGHFTTVSSESRRYIASIAVADGSLNAWNPGAENTGFVIAVSSDDSQVYAGGEFVSAGGGVRNRLAAIDLSADSLLDWNPNANDAVHTLEFSSDKSTFFAGGAFTAIGGNTRNRAAQINVSTGAVTSWNPNADGVVKSIQASSDGNTVYIGGFFQNIAGKARKYLAALSATTAETTTWDPAPNYNVYSIRLGHGGAKLYVGGDFTKIGSKDYMYIAAVRTATGDPDAWADTADSTVRCLELKADGNTLYVGGKFTSIGGKTRNRIAALSSSDGKATDWNPGADNDVYTLKLSSDEKQIYAGGTFSKIGSASRTYAVALNTSTSSATSWNPIVNQLVLTFAIPEDGSPLVMGGEFTKIAGQERQYLAGFESGYSHLTVDSGSGDGNYDAGTVVNIKANIPPTGHNFEKWTGDTSYILDTTSADTKVTMPSSDITAKANYEPATFTVTFAAGENGSIKGKTPQTITYGRPTANVTAIPDVDYKFENWTGTGTWESADNPLKITDVAEDMDITANFGPKYPSANLTVVSSPVAGGTTDPSGTEETMIDRPFTLNANPADGYHFASWTGTANADITHSSASSTHATISGDATITANFAVTPAQAQLTMAVLPVGAGVTTPTGTSTVDTETPISITATANDGYYFKEWTYSSAAAVVADSLSASTTVTLYNDATVTANFAAVTAETKVTVGKIYNLDVADVPGIANFAKAPKAIAPYTDPVSGTIKKGKLKNKTKIVKDAPVNTVDLEWTSKFPLLSTKLWTADKSSTTKEILDANPPAPPAASLSVKATDSNGNQTDDYVDTGIDLSQAQPKISGVYNSNGQKITAAKLEDIITIKGTLFGNKMPKVWMEYVDQKGFIKKLKLKVDRKLFPFPDYKGNPAKSSMNIDTGESQLTVSMPKKWPKTWTHVGHHNLVIDNKICRATIEFASLP